MVYQDPEKRGSCDTSYAHTPLTVPPKNNPDFWDGLLLSGTSLSRQERDPMGQPVPGPEYSVSSATPRPLFHLQVLLFHLLPMSPYICSIPCQKRWWTSPQDTSRSEASCDLRSTKLCPLTEVANGDVGVIKIHIPFSMIDPA